MICSLKRLKINRKKGNKNTLGGSLYSLFKMAVGNREIGHLSVTEFSNFKFKGIITVIQTTCKICNCIMFMNECSTK